MSAQQIQRARIRAFLDGLLITLLVLAAVIDFRPVDAQSGQSVAGVQSAAPLPADPQFDFPKTENELVDNKLLAALIAAENAALTPPLFLFDLPFVVR